MEAHIAPTLPCLWCQEPLRYERGRGWTHLEGGTAQGAAGRERLPFAYQAPQVRERACETSIAPCLAKPLSGLRPGRRSSRWGWGRQGVDREAGQGFNRREAAAMLQ